MSHSQTVFQSNYIFPNSVWRFHFSPHPHQHLVLSNFFIIAFLARTKLCLIVVFIFLMANDDHLFRYLRISHYFVGVIFFFQILCPFNWVCFIIELYVEYIKKKLLKVSYQIYSLQKSYLILWIVFTWWCPLKHSTSLLTLDQFIILGI